MLHPEIESTWRRGEVLSIADRRQYVLLAMSPDPRIDAQTLIPALVASGARPILAQPERDEKFLNEPDLLERLVRVGCLVQVCSASITDPPGRAEGRMLKGWMKRGLVHLLGSNGHSPSTRPPLMSAAYRQVTRWVGRTEADRIGSSNGMAVVQGLPLRISEPEAATSRWTPKLWWSRRQSSN
jgi:protein-tyrosine phosphatase